MANAAAPSIYEKFVLSKNGKEVNIAGKVTSFDYFESLLSPNVTATVTFSDTGNSVPFESKYDKQQRLGSIYNALPLTGGEKLEIKIRSKLGTLNFTKNFFLVNAITNPVQEGQREAVALSLVSPQSFENQQSAVSTRYRGRISDSVKKLLSVNLKIPTTRIEVEDTKNSYNFVGNTQSPFEVICWLSSKSVPASNGDPGFFFYETQDGFKFKSIDSLIRQQPKATYFRNDGIKSSIDNDRNDFKISSFTLNKNQDVLNALKTGVYVSRNLFWDPRDFRYQEVIVALTGKITNNPSSAKDFKKEALKSSLGKSPEIPQSLVSKDFTRTHYHILDIGTLEPSVNGSVNNNPLEYQAKSTIRYNLLYTQVLNMIVPCNPDLRAGDIIKCEFEMVTTGQKELGYMDPTQSGNYMIMNLCHHFDPKRSFTSLTLVRDTYGLYTNKTFI